MPTNISNFFATLFPGFYIYAGSGGWVHGLAFRNTATSMLLYAANAAGGTSVPISGTSTPGGTAWAAGAYIRWMTMYENV